MRLDSRNHQFASGLPRTRHRGRRQKLRANVVQWLQRHPEASSDEIYARMYRGYSKLRTHVAVGPYGSSMPRSKGPSQGRCVPSSSSNPECNGRRGVPAQAHACHSHAIIPRAPTKNTLECNGLLGRELVTGEPPWRQPRGKSYVNLPQIPPDSGGICMGVDSRNHRFAPGLPPGWWAPGPRTRH